MRKILRMAIPIATGLLTFAAGRYFFPPAPTGQMNCVFQLTGNTPPARSANPPIMVSRVDFTAQLTNRSEQDGVFLWYVEGAAKLGDQSRILSGVVFLNPDDVVRGMALWEDRPRQDGDKLRIATLNGDGELDWNREAADVSFESEPGKRRHPFRYRCHAVG